VIDIIECPRDAMQGIKAFIPTEDKIRYINQLLKVGFDTIDFGSFVSPRAIPQMADTALVLNKLELDEKSSDLLAIVANKRGAIDACFFNEIKFLGYPFSISETFQQRNLNSTIAESLERVKQIKELADTHNKKLQIYISMGFGNPYGDPWDISYIQKWVDELIDLDIDSFSLADTVGLADPDDIESVYCNLIEAYPKISFGGHFHTVPDKWKEKVEAAYNGGCRRFDGAIMGLGGCPMAKDDLVGNMPTEKLIDFAVDLDLKIDLDKEAFMAAKKLATEIFPEGHL